MEVTNEAKRARRGDIKSRDDGLDSSPRFLVCVWTKDSMADISFIGAVQDEWQLYRFFIFVSFYITFTYHLL